MVSNHQSANSSPENHSMQTITLHSRVSADGILRLEVPLPADHADSEVRVTILPLTFPHKTPGELGYPPGFFGEVIGGWEGEPLVIDDQTESNPQERLS
jgi:hypothetical protein